MTATADLLDRLQSLGFEVKVRPGGLRVRYLAGPVPPPETRDLLAELKRRKAEALALLTATSTIPFWDEAAARGQLRDIWIWADRTTPSGCWAALPPAVRRPLEEDLDRAFDSIDGAFGDQDPAALTAGLEAFRRTVTAATEHCSR